MHHYEMLEKVKRYTDLQVSFGEICKIISDALPPNNSFGIEIKEISELEVEISILKNKAKMIFGYIEENNQLKGTITIVLIKNKEEHQEIAKLYFDKLKNWKRTLDYQFWEYSFSDTSDITNDFTLFVLGAFFENKNP